MTQRRSTLLANVLPFLLVLGTVQPSWADDPKVTAGEQGLVVRGKDDAYTFELGGRLHADFGTGSSQGLMGEVPLGAALRRIWVEPKVTIEKDLIFNLQYDPSSATTPINNLYLSYKGLSSGTITAGNFKEPFSLEQLISNNNTTFMERSLADTFAPARNTGLAFGTHGHHWSLSAGLFGGNINSGVDQGGFAGTIRATFAPILAEKEVLHFGIAGSYRAIDRSNISFDTRPESFLFKTSLVDTETITGARAVARLGLEAAYTNGPLRLQSEFISARVERDLLRDVAFEGGYIYAAWALNGSAASYTLDADTATEIAIFKGIKPSNDQRVSRGGIGVFELAARYSAINLSSLDVRGGFEQDFTAGLNWYPEPFARVMANYVHAWANPTAVAVTGRAAQADIFQMRLQVAF